MVPSSARPWLSRDPQRPGLRGPDRFASPRRVDLGCPGTIAADATGAVIRHYAPLEQERRDPRAGSGIADLDKRSGTQLAALGVKHKLWTEESAEAVRGVSVLRCFGASVPRNLAADGGASEFTPEKVSECETLVDAIILSLRQKPRES